MKNFIITLSIFGLVCTSCNQLEKGHFEAKKATEKIIIDGHPSEKSWSRADWNSIDERWLGSEFTPEDFSGKFKLTWDDDFIYLLVEVVDDTVVDRYENPFQTWWDDDCVEIFIDENRSKGEHTYSHNAFAYHVALNYNVVDMGPDKDPHLYNDHIKAVHIRKSKISTWEIAMKVFDDSYMDGKTNTPVKLNEGKIVGFALAYCDADTDAQRENFIGTIPVEGEDKNRGYIDAGIFGTLKLVE